MVHIFATHPKGENLGSGFVWLDPTHVVTALHVVAGTSRIEVRSESAGKGTLANIEKANLAADLALLKLTDSFGLPPLTVAPAQLSEEHTIWGYPLEVFKMQGDDIRFSRTLEQASTLLSIFQTEERFKQAVGNQGYPSVKAQILRVSSIITHGFSGAPILNKAGQVVGIGDGGLNQGIARVNWAIPAATYLRGLDSFMDPAPRQIAATASLMSATREKPAAIANQPAASTLRWSWSASLSDIIDSLPEKDDNEIDQSDLEDVLDGLSDAVLSTTIIDVYEDSETGATIAVPRGMKVSWNPTSKQFDAFSADRIIAMRVKIATEDALAERRTFAEDYLTDARVRGVPDTEHRSSDGEFWFFNGYRRIVDAQTKQARSEQETTLIVEDGDFLGVVVSLGWENGDVTPDVTRLFQITRACVMLTDFPTD